jgi:hypothetical protein
VGRVFRSHFEHVMVTALSVDGPEQRPVASQQRAGGADMGGAVLTIQSETNYINDTGGQCRSGCEQLNGRQW